jgi:hypothetical protein
MVSTTCRGVARTARTAKTAKNAWCAYVLRTRKPLCNSKDIWCVGEASGSDESRERFERDERDRTAEALLHQVGRREEPVVRLRVRRELSEEFRAAPLLRPPTQDRAKQRAERRPACESRPDMRRDARLLGHGWLPEPAQWTRHVPSAKRPPDRITADAPLQGRCMSRPRSSAAAHRPPRGQSKTGPESVARYRRPSSGAGRPAAGRRADS